MFQSSQMHQYQYTYNFWRIKPKLNFKFLFTTSTGLILFINTIIFILMVIYEPSSFIFPGFETLERFGAKSPAALINHHYWVFITAIFVHIGVVHFSLNSLALFIIGPQIEDQIGKLRFLIIYIISGIFGNILSAYFFLGTSAGASGAIFGILGVGLYFEKKFAYELKKYWGIKLRRGPYTGLIVINLILGFLISSGGVIGVDNAAHIGGAVCGFILAFCLFAFNFYFLKVFLFSVVVSVSLLIIMLSSKYDFYKMKIDNLINESMLLKEQIELCNLGIKLNPKEGYFYFKKAELLIQNGFLDLALEELKTLNWNIKLIKELELLIQRLQDRGMLKEALILELFLKEVKNSIKEI